MVMKMWFFEERNRITNSPESDLFIFSLGRSLTNYYFSNLIIKKTNGFYLIIKC